MKRSRGWRWLEAFALGCLFVSAVVFIVELILGHPGYVSSLIFEALVHP